MRTGEKNEGIAKTRTKGRAVLVGLGLDDSGGHFRVTRTDEARLFGGSEETHDEMRSRVVRIMNELGRQGYTLDNITREQLPEIERIVARVSEE